MYTQKNSNHLRSRLRERALDHSRLGLENKFLENKSGRIFCVQQVREARVGHSPILIAKRARSGAPWVRKFGKLSIPENLIMT